MHPVATEPRRQPDDDFGPGPDRRPRRPRSPAATFWIRTIALFEGAKGLLVLCAGTGLIYLVDKDVQSLAARLIAHLHLDPAHHYPSIFLKAADNATPERLRILALGAFLYAAFRIAEGVGLWMRRRWAEWLAVATGLIYVPFEVAAFIHRPRFEPVVALVANLAVVLFLAFRLKAGDWTKRKKQDRRQSQPA
jgi:uncharacterized membrane protein (DUF2068 family)